MRGNDQSEDVRVSRCLPVLVTCLRYAHLVSAFNPAYLSHLLILCWSYLCLLLFSFSLQSSTPLVFLCNVVSTSSFVFPDAEGVTSSANVVVVSRYGCRVSQY